MNVHGTYALEVDVKCIAVKQRTVWPKVNTNYTKRRTLSDVLMLSALELATCIVFVDDWFVVAKGVCDCPKAARASQAVSSF